MHHEDAAGDQARHAIQDPLEGQPMSPDEAFRFMKGCVEAWLQWRHDEGYI